MNAQVEQDRINQQLVEQIRKGEEAQKKSKKRVTGFTAMRGSSALNLLMIGNEQMAKQYISVFSEEELLAFNTGLTDMQALIKARQEEHAGVQS